MACANGNVMYIELKRYLSSITSVARLAEAYRDLLAQQGTPPEQAIRARDYLNVTLGRLLDSSSDGLYPSVALTLELANKDLSFAIGCELQMASDDWKRHLSEWGENRCLTQFESFRAEARNTHERVCNRLERVRAELDAALAPKPALFSIAA